MKKLALILCSLVLFSSCATIFSGRKAKVTVTSDDLSTPVSLTVDGKKLPPAYFPQMIKVKRGFKPSIITGDADGYETATVVVNKKFNPTSYINAVQLVGSIIGFGLDCATGAVTKPDQNTYVMVMNRIAQQPTQIYNYPSYIPTPAPEEPKEPVEQRVTRESAGQTNLERTIIRWFIDSEPRGARVFWRVISSCPAEVKNTNESYLGSTPYEDTRSFNIQGLTYENSRDVQIEIKLTRKGYLDMVKRFNVRQTIDQMEISTFFDMVPAE